MTLQPLKVTRPATAALGFVVQLSVAAPALVSERVTGAVLVVTTLPPLSTTDTLGWVENDVLRGVLPGTAVKISRDAGPTAIVNDVLVAEVRPVDWAVNVYVPARSIEQPENVAVPDTALTGFETQVRVAAPGLVSTRVTGAVLVVEPPTDPWMATTGCTEKVAPPVPLDGLARNTSFLGATRAATLQLLPVFVVEAMKLAEMGETTKSSTINPAIMAIAEAAAAAFSPTVPRPNRPAPPLVDVGGGMVVPVRFASEKA